MSAPTSADSTRLAELLSHIERELDATMSPHRLALGELGMDRNGFVPCPYSDAALRHWRGLLMKDPHDLETLHHLAIAVHAKAIDLEASRDATRSDELWKEAVSYWARLVASDSFWERLAHSIGRDASDHEIQAQRERLPASLIRIHFDIAFDDDTPNHRAQFHVECATRAPFGEAALCTAREDVYEQFSRRFPEEVWIAGQCDGEILSETCGKLIAFLELDPENVTAATDLLRFQMRLVHAGGLDLAALGSGDPPGRKRILGRLAEHGARCGPYLTTLIDPSTTLEEDLGQDIVRWHRIMGDVHRALERFAAAVQLYDAPAQLDGVDKTELALCHAGAAESQALHARQLASAGNQAALSELASLERRDRLTTWSCLYAAEAYAKLEEYGKAETVCDRGEQITVAADEFGAEKAAESEQGRLHLRELRRILEVRRILALAREHLAKQQGAQALRLLNTAKELSPTANVVSLRAQCLHMVHDHHGADKELDELENLVRDEPESLEQVQTLRADIHRARFATFLTKAREHIKSKNFKLAMSFIDGAAKLDPHSGPMLFTRIQCLLALGRQDEADQDTNRFRKLVKGDKDALKALDTMLQDATSHATVNAMVEKYKREGADAARQHVEAAARAASSKQQKAALSRALSMAAVQIANDVPSLDGFGEALEEVIKHVKAANNSAFNPWR